MSVDLITIDFETKGIEARPHYPPEPVGVSIQHPGEKRSHYYAWGHPTQNNCTKAEGKRQLQRAWKEAKAGRARLLFHNAKFDYDVAMVHMGLPPLPWDALEDTQYLLFLTDPHANTFSLKPSAARILRMPAEEQDVVREWVLANVPEAKKRPSEWGAHIWRAPGDVVGRYADGDVLRTIRLHKRLMPQVRQRGMLQAYDRERELMPILLRNEEQGIRVDVKMIEHDEALYSAGVAMADEWLRRRLKVPDLNVDSNEELADALENAGIVTEWVPTKKGQRSTAKKNMTPDLFKDPRVYQVLGWRNRASTCLGTYMRPWLTTARQSGGLVFLNWNQVRQMRNGDRDMAGARTGRMSCNPNLMAVSKDWYDKDDGYSHPAFLLKDALWARVAKAVASTREMFRAFEKGLPELPLVRKYILPDKGGVWCHRDYNQQELRILGHYENGTLMEAYRKNPLLDVHTWVMDEIRTMLGLKLERRPVKILNFGTIYGRGYKALAEALHTDIKEAMKIKKAQLSAVPGLKDLIDDITTTAKEGEPIRTWGGREYFVEEPRIVDGRLQEFYYKLLNYLIQGSAADVGKQAIINYDKVKKEGRWLLFVHDENNISAPKGAHKAELKLLKEAMEDVKFDVPMISDAAIGPRWGELTKLKEAA